MNVEDMERELRKLIPKMEVSENEDGENIKSIYIGSYMSLDPCGKYHNFLSPNGVTEECKKYWENLEKAALNLNGFITSGEGDPTDIYFEMLDKDKI